MLCTNWAIPNVNFSSSTSLMTCLVLLYTEDLYPVMDGLLLSGHQDPWSFVSPYMILMSWIVIMIYFSHLFCCIIDQLHWIVLSFLLLRHYSTSHLYNGAKCLLDCLVSRCGSFIQKEVAVDHPGTTNGPVWPITQGLEPKEGGLDHPRYHQFLIHLLYFLISLMTYFRKLTHDLL